jgi:hypothetical protein
MLVDELANTPQNLDVIVAINGDTVIAEIDVENNSRMRVGDRYTARWGDDVVTILRVSEFKSPEDYTNTKARCTEAMREGVTGVPQTRTARMAYQRKLAALRIEGELLPDGSRKVGAGRVPDVMVPIHPIKDDDLERFATTPDGNFMLGNLVSGSRKLKRVARIQHIYSGDRLLVLGMPGKGKTQKVRSLLVQAMADSKLPRSGFLVLDRKGEYIRDVTDQRGNTVPGLHHHPNAKDQMVSVSMRSEILNMAKQGVVYDSIHAQFSISDIDPVDLADFLPGLTPTQAELLRDYAHIDGFYEKLLSETQFGSPDHSRWYQNFPGLYDLSEKGKQLVKGFETLALKEGRHELTVEEQETLETTLTGTKPGVLARAANRIKRFCNNPFFGASAKARDILAANSCVEKILQYLSEGKVVFLDMRGQSDEDYTLVAAIFARRLLTENKERDDTRHIHACLILEEAHNILSEKELEKGSGTGSVFIEFAREGRSYKLGFVLVTQQPDVKSIAAQVVKTIDTIIVFNMPPEDAKHLMRLKPAFQDLELEISNAPEFRGVAVSAGGAISFASQPVDVEFMRDAAANRLERTILASGDVAPAQTEPVNAPVAKGLQERIAALSKLRRQEIERVALDTINAWSQPSTKAPRQDLPS